MISADKPIIITKARLGARETTSSTVTIVGISNRHRAEFKDPTNYKWANKSELWGSADVKEPIKVKDPLKNKILKEFLLTVNIWKNTMNWITLDINPIHLGHVPAYKTKIDVSILWFERDTCYRDYAKRFYISREVIRYIEINLLKNNIKKNVLFRHFILKKKGLSPDLIMLILDLLF